METRGGDSHSGQVILAVEDYHEARVTYPETLTQPVPTYPEALPRARWRLNQGEVIYRPAPPGRSG